MEKNAIHKVYESQLKLELTRAAFGLAYFNSKLIKSLQQEGKYAEAANETQRLWDEAEKKAMEHQN